MKINKKTRKISWNKKNMMAERKSKGRVGERVEKISKKVAQKDWKMENEIERNMIHRGANPGNSTFG